MSSPYVITLTPLDESVLRSRARSSTAAHRDVVRARIVLAAAEGATNAGIAAEVGVHVDTVRKWRRRFLTAGLPGLEDRPRSGRRRGFTPVQVAEVKALACTLPAETGAPLSRWSSTELANEVIDQPGDRRDDLGGHRAPLAGLRRDQALAAPVLDLPPRPRLCHQGRPGARPVCPRLGGQEAGPPRLRDQRR
jgi:transposase